MRTDFKFINGRDIRTIGYDPEHKICVIECNHIHGGKSLYCYNVERDEFDKLMISDNISDDAENLYINKKQH